MYLRRGEDRGSANFGWLKSFHSFSFGNYYDPSHMGFSVLKVINDDTVIGSAGFDTHGHRDMEIISYVMEGALQHKDTMGNIETVPAGDVQRMSAGSGVMHSEYNASETEPVHFLQIWVEPNVKGIKPEYEQKTLKKNSEKELIISSDGRDESLRIHQDVSIYRLANTHGKVITFDLKNRSGYLHVVAGKSELSTENHNPVTLCATDGVGIEQDTTLTIEAKDDHFEALWFDLPRA